MGQLAFESRWAAPFLICAAQGEPRAPADPEPTVERPVERRPLAELAREPDRFAGLLSATAQTAQAVYQRMLAEYGTELGLRPLEAEHGGRPDLGMGVRSFPDGFPLVLWMWVGETSPARERWGDWQATQFGQAAGLVRRRQLVWFIGDGEECTQVSSRDGAGTAESMDPDRTVGAVVATLLQAFGRQANKWTNFDGRSGVIPLGLGDHYARWLNARDGGQDPGLFLSEYLALRRHFASSDRPWPVPWIPLDVLLASARSIEVRQWMQDRGLSGDLGVLVLRAQAAGLARFLGASDDPGRRAAWTGALRAFLERGRPREGVQKALNVRDEDDWEALQKEFESFMDGLVRVEAPASTAPAPRSER
jgi:hypothetical protein